MLFHTIEVFRTIVVQDNVTSFSRGQSYVCVR